MSCRRLRRTGCDDSGSVIPLIVGFWLLAAIIITGAIALGDAFTKERDLQALCDGAAIAGANSVDPSAVHGGGVKTTALPLEQVSSAVQTYLSRDGNSGVRSSATVEADGVTVRVVCRRHVHIAFGAVIGKGGGIDQNVAADARSPLDAP